MKEKEYDHILDRNFHIVDLKTHYSDILDVMHDMVNYGSNLIPRCFTSSKRKLEDAVIIGVLLRQALVMFDAFEVLISSAAVYASNLQARAIFETSLYLEWILKDNTTDKAKYYYVRNLRQERLWAQRTQSESPESIAFKSLMEPFGDVADKSTNQLEEEGKKSLAEINDLLGQSVYKSINKSFEDYKKKRKLTYEPPWHAPLGLSSVRQIAVDLGRLHEYETFYSASSEVMHSSKHKDHVVFKEGKMHFQPIRYLEGISIVLHLSLSMMLKMYMLVLDHYRPGERPAFQRKYVADWQQAFRNIKSVKYEDKGDSTLII